jgi:choline dehydrogenase-like flavoprotein
MGTAPSSSVVDVKQRSWDHANLFLVGSGSMPSIGTSNPTLTLAALCFSTAETIAKDLERASTGVTVTA